MYQSIKSSNTVKSTICTSGTLWTACRPAPFLLKYAAWTEAALWSFSHAFLYTTSSSSSSFCLAFERQNARASPEFGYCVWNIFSVWHAKKAEIGSVQIPKGIGKDPSSKNHIFYI